MGYSIGGDEDIDWEMQGKEWGDTRRDSKYSARAKSR